MKTSSDPRHQHRRALVQDLFTHIFDPSQVNTEVNKILSQLELIDQNIQTAAPEWPIAKINHVDLAILRLATYELLVVKKEPVKVIIDEAVELAKEFGSETSPSFVNGALGAIAKKLALESVSSETLNSQTSGD